MFRGPLATLHWYTGPVLTLALPLPATELPDALKRFADPAAPDRARTMAAKGLVPIKGSDLVGLLVQLSRDALDEVRDAARATLEGLPSAVLEAACEAPLHPAFLDALADDLRGKDDLIERIAANAASANETVARIARSASERVCERIALNEQRVLAYPTIIEALYKNKQTRMSTVDRLIELAVRNGVTVDGIPTFEAHAQAIQGQLIVEPTDEPLPDDILFNQAMEADDDPDAIEVDAVDGSETVREKYKPLTHQIAEMNLAQKLRFCMIGPAAARSILVRDSNKQVAFAAISSPQTTEAEATGIANSRQVSEEVLRFIGNKREWLGNYELKRNLIFNPKTPAGISMKFLAHLQTNDLRTLSRSKGIPSALKSAALQRVAKKNG